jgi:hypothetical protein
LFKIRFINKTTIKTTYEPLLSSEAKEAKKALQVYFKHGSVLSKIRNQIAFHYYDKDTLMEKSFQQLPQSEPLQFYLTETVGNDFYHAAELLVEAIALDLVTVPAAKQTDSTPAEARALNALYNDIIKVSQDITKLFGNLIVLLSESVVTEGSTEQIPAPKLSDLSLPYFIDVNR